MQSIQGKIAVAVSLMGILWFSGLQIGNAQSGSEPGTVTQTGYDVKKPIIGGACPTCPWGAMSEVVKTVMQPYGWDIQICYYCAGGPRATRMVAGAMLATPPEDPVHDNMPTPEGPVDFGVTSATQLRSAYLGENDFASDPQGPRHHLRVVANIQAPAYYIVAVKASLGITDLSEIAEKRIPVSVMASTVGQRQFTPAVLEYYGISKEQVLSFGGIFAEHYSRSVDFDVLLGFGSLVNAPEFEHWYHATQKYDLKHLELAPDLREQLLKQFYVEVQDLPLGYFRGVDKPVPTLAQNGIVIYGRTDMPDDFAYTLARAIDERQDLLAWRHMNWSYNWRTVWDVPNVPLHPGAERYYKEKGYMEGTGVKVE